MSTLSTSSQVVEKVEHKMQFQPLKAAASLLLFGVPATITFVAFHFLRPWIESWGYDELTSFLASLIIPLSLLFLAALAAYHMEGHSWTWHAFAERMRLPRLRWRDVLWGLAIFVVGGLGVGLFSALVLSLIEKGWMPIPSQLPGIADPRVTFTPALLAYWAGGMIHGRWDIALLYLAVFFFNVVGEELWWRGYILPRQELAFGRNTWWIHGVMWAFFHVFKWWDILPLLPMCLITAYCAQRTRTTWGGLIGHVLSNGMSMAAILWFIVR